MADCPFKNLSFEILVAIVGFYRRDRDDIRSLSLVCKAFNDACSAFLFSSYTVYLYEARNSNTGNVDRRYTQRRIAVLLRKAPYIRKLTIRDGRRLWLNKNESQFSYDLLRPPEQLWVALNGVTGVRKLRLWNDASRNNEPRRIPQRLWNWMESQSGNHLSQIDLQGLWSLPTQASIIDKLACLRLSPLTQGNVKLLKFLKAPNLTIINKDFMDVAPFKPRLEDDHLRDVRIYIIMDNWDPFLRREKKWARLLDFSGAPSAHIFVEVRSTRFDQYEGDLGKFGEFLKLCYAAKTILSEDIDEFDVVRYRTEARLYVTRYPGMKVERQDHQMDEQEKMARLLSEFREREKEVRALSNELKLRGGDERRRWVLDRIRRLGY